jgi:hypothetical protein
MRLSVTTNLFYTASLLLFSTLSAAAQTPDSTISRTRPTGTLVTLGTGIITPGFELGGYRGLFLPLVLGVEHYLSPTVSIQANGFSGFRLSTRNFFGRSGPSIGHYGFNAALRYYYNQEKRRQKGRATGPFVGNYVALQASSVFQNSVYDFSSRYQYSGVAALWGMQRRLGNHGRFDAYTGISFNRAGEHSVVPDFDGKRYALFLELGIKASLSSHLRIRSKR